MLTAADVAVAIEAKYTEPRYERVTKWLRKGSDLANRKAVLAHWLHLIQAKTEAPVGEEQLGSLVYQMVHRTASACAVATGRRRPVVAHLLFGRGAKRREEYVEDVQRAQAVLDPGGRIEILVIEVGVTPSPRVEELYERHRRRDRSTAEEVKAALLDGPPLYELDPPVTVTDSRRRPEEELSGRPRPRGTAS